MSKLKCQLPQTLGLSLGIGFVLVYVVMAQTSMFLAETPGNVTPLYPAAGLAWVLHLNYHARSIPWIYVAAALSNSIPNVGSEHWLAPIGAGLFIGVGECLTVIFATWLYRRWGQPGIYLSSLRDLSVFALLAFFWWCSPTVGVSSLLLFGLISFDQYLHVWVTWWVGDSIGVLMCAPLLIIILLSQEKLSRSSFKGLGLAVCIALMLSALVSYSQLPLWYLMTAVCLYYAFRLSQIGVVVVALCVSIVSVWANFLGYSPNLHFDMNTRLLLLQAFIAFSIVVSLVFWNVQNQVGELKQLWSKADREARIDPLTGILNRRGFEEKASKMLSHESTSVCLLILDIDKFKQVNDVHGHDAGDDALFEFAKIAKSACRTQDILTRVGGEEFAVIMETDPGNAMQTAERIRKNVELGFAQPVNGKLMEVTVSIGVAHFNGKESLHDLIKRADACLYRAKSMGRNRVVLL